MRSGVDREQASRLRQEMGRALLRMDSLLREIQGHEALVKGTLYRRRRRWSDGSVVLGEAFSSSQLGRTRHAPVGAMDRDRLSHGVSNYRRFRAARAQLCKQWAALLEMIDRMEALRRVPVEDLLIPSGRTRKRQEKPS